MNKIELTGRITKEIELRYTQSNKAVGNFSLAVNRKFKNQNGEYEADFINCIVFDKLAETIKEYVKKGDLIGVCGRLQVRNYTDKDGNKKYITEVVVEEIDFLQSKTNVKENVEKPKEDKFNNAFEEFGEEHEDDLNMELPF
jgi:single-strand DNA-binding protein